MDREPKIGLLTAEFCDPRAEERFRRWKYRDNLLAIRIIAVIGIVAAIPFFSALYVRLGTGADFQVIAAVRFASLLLSLTLLYGTWAKWSYRTLDWLVLAAVFAMCSQPVTMSLISASEIKLLEVQYILVAVAVYVFVPNRFVFNVIPCLLLSAVFMVHVLWVGDYIASERIGLIGWTVIANALGIVTAQRLDRLRRRTFANLELERNANDALRAAKERVELESRSKTEFLANMSHELRTPLNAINGFSEMMLQGTFGPLGDRRYKEYAKDINESGTHLLGLINEILDLSKVEAGKRELAESRIDIAQLIDDCLRVVRQRATEKEITLQTDLPPGLPDVWVDEVGIKQVLLNLIVNGIKFTGSGGHVAVSAHLELSGALRIDVRDNGIGIDPAHLDRVTVPFGQVEEAASRQHEGTGLGLAIAKAMVELHGGGLNIESEVGKGTTVSVHLPATRLLENRVALSA